MTRSSTLQGHHRIWHVLPEHHDRRRMKVCEPLENALWFDRRCFDSEEALVMELNRLGMSGIPAARWADGHHVPVLDFIEGDTFIDLFPGGTRVPEVYLAQIMRRFAELAGIRPSAVGVERRCRPEDRPADGDSGAFLRGLLRFTHECAYLGRLPEYRELFERLGIPPDAVGPGTRLWSEAGELAARPFCLLHGDLHRANFVVDAADRLWTIDWELALLGDPLYDLATHLYLMDYPPSQRSTVISRWRTTVSGVLPGADDGLDEDLPRYLAYKRAQSVYTDVVRQMRTVEAAASEEDLAHRLRSAAKTVYGVLSRGSSVLGQRTVPGPGEIEEIYAALLRRNPGAGGRRGGPPPADASG